MNRFETGNRYISRGVDETIPQYLIMMLWQYIDFLKDKCELDYLQCINDDQPQIGQSALGIFELLLQSAAYRLGKS